MNKTVYRMFMFHLICCIVLATAAFSWNDTYGMYTHYLNLGDVDLVDKIVK